VGGARCLIIAEAGVNHNGDVGLAHRLVDVAADAAADVIKFQTFDPDRLVARDAPKAEYQVARTSAGETQRDMLRKLRLPREAYIELRQHATERGLAFLSTPFDEASADFLVQLGVPALKVPSGEITNHPLLAHVARQGLPLLVSTGMASLDEVSLALAVIAANGNPPVALFHCVTSYPATPADCNLAAMAAMRALFAVPAGWSDHTQGVGISCAAVAMGAELLEKHFTTDRSLPGPDHAASLEPEELRTMIAAVRAVEAARGDGVKKPAAAEVPLAAVVRRSLHARGDLAPGSVLTAADLIALRPGTGIPPSSLASIVGRTLACAVSAGQMLREADLE
jgi:N-acetylneuraminate synthase